MPLTRSDEPTGAAMPVADPRLLTVAARLVTGAALLAAAIAATALAG